MKPPERIALALDALTHAQRHYPAFRTNLADRMADGYPRTASGGDKAPGGATTLAMDRDTGEIVSVDLTATEAAVVARQRYADHWNEVVALAIEIQAGAQLLDKLVTRYAYTEQQAVAQRCTCSMGHDGSDVWGDPTCQRNAVTRDGLSDACRQRRDHWRTRSLGHATNVTTSNNGTVT